MQARSNCLWALAVLQGLNLPAFPVLVKAMISRSADWLDLEPVQRHQLFQVTCYCSCSCSGKFDYPLLIE